jgi:hypothetical protein
LSCLVLSCLVFAFLFFSFLFFSVHVMSFPFHSSQSRVGTTRTRTARQEEGCAILTPPESLQPRQTSLANLALRRMYFK